MRTQEEIKQYRKEHYWLNREKYIRKAKEWKENHRARIREQTNAIRDANREELRERMKGWSKDNKTDYSKKYPERYSARKMFYNAFRRGEIPKPPLCEMCGEYNKRLNGHHFDYSKPLDVYWVCPLCHGKLHRMENEKLSN